MHKFAVFELHGSTTYPNNYYSECKIFGFWNNLEDAWNYAKQTYGAFNKNYRKDNGEILCLENVQNDHVIQVVADSMDTMYYIDKIEFKNIRIVN